MTYITQKRVLEIREHFRDPRFTRETLECLLQEHLSQLFLLEAMPVPDRFRCIFDSIISAHGIYPQGGSILVPIFVLAEEVDVDYFFAFLFEELLHDFHDLRREGQSRSLPCAASCPVHVIAIQELRNARDSVELQEITMTGKTVSEMEEVGVMDDLNITIVSL